VAPITARAGQLLVRKALPAAAKGAAFTAGTEAANAVASAVGNNAEGGMLLLLLAMNHISKKANDGSLPLKMNPFLSTYMAKKLKKPGSGLAEMLESNYFYNSLKKCS